MTDVEVDYVSSGQTDLEHQVVEKVTSILTLRYHVKGPCSAMLKSEYLVQGLGLGLGLVFSKIHRNIELAFLGVPDLDTDEAMARLSFRYKHFGMTDAEADGVISGKVARDIVLSRKELGSGSDVKGEQDGGSGFGRRKLGLSSDGEDEVRLRPAVKMCLLVGTNVEGEERV
ncbi:Atp Synthase F(0) Complex Subunit C2 [Manis pentadactyla]|nr:Atp Synthase F(0) Complex Subunit C2 [Manis pentadactyla]